MRGIIEGCSFLVALGSSPEKFHPNK